LSLYENVAFDILLSVSRMKNKEVAVALKNKEAAVALCATCLVLFCEISGFKNQLLVKAFLPVDVTLLSIIKIQVDQEPAVCPGCQESQWDPGMH